MRRASLLTLLSSAVVLLGFAAPASAVQCGDVITTSTTLTEDLVCPDTFRFEALTIMADDVRLDLGGHTIRAGANGGTIGVTGVDPAGGTLQQVRVLSGTIEGFREGVSLPTAVDSQVRRLTVNATQTGITMGVFDGTEGAGIQQCERNVSNCVARNVVDVPGGIGIELYGNESEAWGNTVLRSSYGIAVTGDRPRVALNTIEGCDNFGVVVGSYTTYAIVWKNTITGCSSIGIQLAGFNARVRRNVVTGTDTGIAVNDISAFVALNDSSGNRIDGIDILATDQGVANLVQDNTANNNGQYGIYADAGTLDGGGNTASGNGFQNCLNVTCGP
jgi:Periplasmic copper-binding protein (NosD)